MATDVPKARDVIPAPTPAHASSTARSLISDPLAPIRALGQRALRNGLVLGIAGTLIVHSAVATQAARTLGAMHIFSNEVRDAIRQRLRQQYDIDLTPPPPPPPPPAPEPEPEAKVPPVAAAPAATPPPPPAPAEAGKVLTQEPDPNEPVDLTGEGFVTGNGEHFAGGVTASNGTSKQAVRDLRAQPGGSGHPPPGPVAAAAPVADLSRPAMPIVAGDWDCGFPAEAEGIDQALVSLTVTVTSEGRPKSVAVLRDPGNGFGERARSCAMRKSFQASLDRNGQPITASTPPFTIRFTR